jgi:hypothetical protein
MIFIFCLKLKVPITNILAIKQKKVVEIIKIVHFIGIKINLQGISKYRHDNSFFNQNLFFLRTKLKFDTRQLISKGFYRPVFIGDIHYYRRICN